MMRSSRSSEPWRGRWTGAASSIFSGALAGAAAFCQTRGDLAHAGPPLRDYPFTLGVASGDPAPSRAVLWTRLAPDIYEPDGGMPHRRVPVKWRVAKDPGMRRVVRQGVALAVPELAHSVHVELSGLDPGREYFFQFKYRDELSPMGRTLTAPANGASVRSLAFAFASCQAWDHGYYSAYRRMAEEDLAFVVHLGDYLYEYGIDEQGGARKVPVPEQFRPECDDARPLPAAVLALQERSRPAAGPPAVPLDHHLGRPRGVRTTMRGWRRKVGDAPHTVTFTGHGGRPPTRPSTRTCRCAPRPCRAAVPPFCTGAWPGATWRASTCSTRASTAPTSPAATASSRAARSPLTRQVTMLGAEQEDWLQDGLARSRARWNVIAQQVMMGQLDHDRGDPRIYWHDAWDGYPAARQRIIDHLQAARVRNPMLITGDWHSTFVNDIKDDFSDPGSATVATEFVGTSISTNGDFPVYGPYYGPMIDANPHIKFFDGDRRGYVRCRLDRRQWRTDLRMVTTVSRSDAPVYTFASFEVEDGTPGAVRV